MTGLAFSPDDDSGGRRLAVAQTDGIVYVYRLGERKSICNKFQVVASLSRAEAKRDASGANGAPVTCLAWSASQVRTSFAHGVCNRIASASTTQNTSSLSRTPSSLVWRTDTSLRGTAAPTRPPPCTRPSRGPQPWP